ncbi:MAG: ABC transporter permease [Chloroflexota bacterium]
MHQYIARRLLMFLPVLFGVSVLIFLLMRVIPGDVARLLLSGGGEGGTVNERAVQKVRQDLGLDKPLHVQYVNWITSLARLEGGRSYYSGRLVLQEIAQRLPLTVELAAFTIVIAVLIAVPLGALAAVRQDTWLDYVLRVVSIGGLAMPTFWTATLIILGLAVIFGALPPLGVTSSLFDDPLRTLQQLVWPALALGYYDAAMISRMTRSQMLEVLRQDYVRTAWAKGLRERMVLVRHALRNALLPVVTIVGLQFAYLLGGTVIMEKIFFLPGMGSALVDSIIRRDYPMIENIVVLFAFMVLVMNLLIDILYAWLDPRIRYA